MTRRERDQLSPAQRLDRLRQGTGRTCTPRRNTGALLHGGGPYCLPFDAIPAIDEPRFVRAGTGRFLPPAEPVIGIEVDGHARAYPVRYLLRHEIVNDMVASEPIVVTYCPLCNSAAAFSSRVAGRALTFGVSGQLVNANLVMFDRQTLSLWTQVEGRAFAGDLERTRLRRLPVVMVSFGQWRSTHPLGLVMRRPAELAIDYAKDPYAGYADDPNQESRFLGAWRDNRASSDPRLAPKRRVLGVKAPRGAIAFPEPRRGDRAVVKKARLGHHRLAALFERGTAMPARDLVLSRSPRGWAGMVWEERIAQRSVDIVVRRGNFVDRHTGSRFDLFGRAISGPLRGRRLEAVPQITSFWFAWSRFYPHTRVA